MKTIRSAGAIALVSAVCALPVQATLITFTGGTVNLIGGGTTTTNNSVTHGGVAFYDEGGFRMSFNPQVNGAFIGNYYSAANDVIHVHWTQGGLGGINFVEITQIGGGTFDFHAFSLTSNTAVGGGAANGTEQAWIQGYVGAVAVTPALLLPTENWGFPTTDITLGSEFDAVDRVVFFATSDVDCFGMDNFFINEVPAPSALALLGLGGLTCGARRSRRRD